MSICAVIHPPPRVFPNIYLPLKDAEEKHHNIQSDESCQKSHFRQRMRLNNSFPPPSAITTNFIIIIIPDSTRNYPSINPAQYFPVERRNSSQNHLHSPTTIVFHSRLCLLRTAVHHSLDGHLISSSVHTV